MTAPATHPAGRTDKRAARAAIRALVRKSAATLLEDCLMFAKVPGLQGFIQKEQRRLVRQLRDGSAIGPLTARRKR